jgi:hypothetical protein
MDEAIFFSSLSLSQLIEIGKDFEYIKSVINEDTDLNPVYPPYIKLPLVAAINRNDIQLVNYLISIGATINPGEGYLGVTPLGAAIGKGNIALADKLIKLGADIKNGQSDISLIKHALESNRVETIKFVLDVQKKLPKDSLLNTLKYSLKSLSFDVVKFVVDMQKELPQSVLLGLVKDSISLTTPVREINNINEVKKINGFVLSKVKAINVKIVNDDIKSFLSFEQLNNIAQEYFQKSPDGNKLVSFVLETLKKATINNTELLNYAFKYDITLAKELLSKKMKFEEIDLIKSLSLADINTQFSILEYIFDKKIHLNFNEQKKFQNLYSELLNKIFTSIEKNDKKIVKSLISNGYTQELLNIIQKEYNDDQKIAFAKLCLTEGIKLSFKSKGLVYTTHEYKSENISSENKENLQKQSETFYKSDNNNAKIYYTHNNKIVPDGDDYLYIFHNDKLYINDTPCVSHSYIVKGQKGQELYQIGRPVASGGHLDIKDGKIISIINDSGHYKPNAEQQKLMIYNLLNHDVLHPNVKIFTKSYYDLTELRLTSIPEDFNMYKDYQDVLKNYVQFDSFDDLENLLLGKESFIDEAL